MRANPTPKVFANSVFLVVAIIILGASAVFAEGPRLNVGVEVFTASPKIITVEEASKIDSSGNSNADIQKQLDAENNKTATQNSNKTEKIKLKVPSSKASKALRDTESAYLAVRLKQLLDDTEKYGMVHVIPASEVKDNSLALSSTAFDYVIRTEILKSNGYIVEFRVRTHSSINGFKGPVLKFKIKDDIPASAYVGDKNATIGVEELEGDPYDVILGNIVSIFNTKVKEEQIMYPVKRHQGLTLTRYGHEVLPKAYKDYRITKESNGYVVDPTPDPANRFVSNVTNCHREELMNIDAFEEHYKKAANDVEGPYNLWRRETRKALIAYMDLKDEIKKIKKAVYIDTLIMIFGEGLNLKTILNRALNVLLKSMVEKDGYVTVVKPPDLERYTRNSNMDEYAYRLKGYNEQLAVQTVKVESLKENFSTLTEPVILVIGSKSKTYYGKLDVAFRRFKEDLRKQYYEETGIVGANKDTIDKSDKTANDEGVIRVAKDTEGDKNEEPDWD